MANRGIRRLLLLWIAAAALAVSPQLRAVSAVPERWVLHQGTLTALPVSAALCAQLEGGAASLCPGEDGSMRLSAERAGEARLTFRLMGMLPVRTVQVAVQPERRLIPGGQSVGIALNTDGVVVVGNSDLGSTASPARLAGLKSGDVIQRVDGQPIRHAEELSACLASGGTVHLEVLRSGKPLGCEVTPVRDSRDGQYKLGAWVRSSTAGVGTLTWYETDSGRYGALGHAVTDVDTGVVLPVGEGALYDNRVVMVTPSRKGAPGELTGDFVSDARQLGSVTQNTDYGLFGVADGLPKASLYPEGLPAANRSEVHTGPATLLTTVDEDGVQAYKCAVERVSDRGTPSTRSLVIRITDQSLLSKTGGIVQGVSGSPILQDGKIIGALTHVMVNEPAMGYGVLIEDMLSAAEAA